ncbi:formylmethanofuran dehydrogenase subunit C [Azohydromonas australica]|uniref:formylmethanofuran dehydrogenase subunit C n=1 Tax=Azohydromonas australica TaxID=364039 RepID=UPI00040DDE55|nr:formylmethanofuran dehydrogenase subunit C [Azohydromonas australica]
MSWRLILRQVPTLCLDMRAIVPSKFAGQGPSVVERLPVWQGNQALALTEAFRIEHSDGPDDMLVIEGDCRRCDRMGWNMDGGLIEVHGPAGDHVGSGLRAGRIHVHGSAGRLAGCEMQGGLLEVDGDVGDFAGAPMPGSMEGMRGGILVVRGQAGARLGDRMRRGLVLVHGDAGDYAASRMVAGTIAVGGALGSHAAWGMRRGSLVCRDTAINALATFVPTYHNVDVFWQLLSRTLARHGGPFASLPGERVQRLSGDLAAGGQGELLLIQ